MPEGETQPFAVKVGEFEGPLDMLLHLIERRKLHISDVSLAEITDEYVERIKSLPDISRDELADFIYVAATLLLIKSLSLLPGTTTTPEEQASIKDLERRLTLYKMAQRGGELIAEKYGAGKIFERGEIPRAIKFSFPPNITLDYIEASMHAALASLPRIIQKQQVSIEKTMTIEEAINGIINRIERAFRTSFREHAGGPKAERVSIIVNFLALLELIKRGSVTASQETPFDDITIENHTCAVPRYGE